ncbi:hypothetical protein [Streptomyces sp. ITFR-6]|uniref:hypothetical protein n=1 Tax=Streptomyces sp. ITFR-6 TaxID=3075197 RepID=UPI00288BCC45|nr:hypothetical protein [Streptomyces sp. ITFR-6]WNI32627.1 hypothetical protein RLT59_30390 [Streptomyces sp. ITFR-6]
MQRPWRSTAIHCGSPGSARQPVPRTPGTAIPSTANSGTVAAYAVEETLTGRAAASSAAAAPGRSFPSAAATVAGSAALMPKAASRVVLVARKRRR